MQSSPNVRAGALALLFLLFGATAVFVCWPVKSGTPSSSGAREAVAVLPALGAPVEATRIEPRAQAIPAATTVEPTQALDVQSPAHPSDARDRLELRGVSADARALYLEVAHVDERSVEHDATDAQAFVNPTGCPSHAIRISGRVSRNQSESSRLVVPLDELPEGDFSIGVRAFGMDATALLRKSGSQVVPIKIEELEGYAVVAADPVFGLPPRVQIPGSRDCEPEGKSL